MATYALSFSFLAKAKTDDKADELSTQIIQLVEAEGLANDGTVIDIELLDDQDEGEDLDFEED